MDMKATRSSPRRDPVLFTTWDELFAVGIDQGEKVMKCFLVEMALDSQIPHIELVTNSKSFLDPADSHLE